MESILTSIKKMLGIIEDYTHFDEDLIIHINSVILILTQIGVGPSEGFRIEDKNAVWNDFLLSKTAQLEFVKTFMYLKVKLLFDPPLSSTVIESIKQSLSELEWRIVIAAEPKSDT